MVEEMEVDGSGDRRRLIALPIFHLTDLAPSPWTCSLGPSLLQPGLCRQKTRELHNARKLSNKAIQSNAIFFSCCKLYIHRVLTAKYSVCYAIHFNH